jgi:alpha-maltose-1-phosphate synthase
VTIDFTLQKPPFEFELRSMWKLLMVQKQLVGVIGSRMIGTDPFDKRSWSGSSHRFFGECLRTEILHRAIGVEAPAMKRWATMLRNFTPNRSTWSLAYHLDTSYYRDLTGAIQASLQSDDYSCDFLQIGGIYNVPSIVKGRSRCFSYHDGNLAQMAQSPYFPKGFSRKKLRSALAYEGEVYASMDLIFTMSEYLRRSFIEDFGVPESKVVIIGGGVNLPEIPEVRHEKDYSTQQILFVGVEFQRKGGPLVLEAFRRVRAARPSATLHIVGPRRLEDIGKLGDGVKFHGFLDRNDPAQGAVLRRLFSDAVLFVMPSLYEPFGIAPLEAMTYQVPCILTNRWAFPEMVEPGLSGELVEPADQEGLTDRMMHLLDRPDLLRGYGAISRNRVMQKYTWESVVSNLCNALALTGRGQLN